MKRISLGSAFAAATLLSLWQCSTWLFLGFRYTGADQLAWISWRRPKMKEARPSRLCRAASENDVGLGRNWRDFRAQLVKLDKAEVDSETCLKSLAIESRSSRFFGGSWAYPTTLVESGSVLFANPGFFSLRQPYFHKAVILIIQDSPSSNLGLILNRPTGLTTKDFGLSGPSWPIWFGGDCGGLMHQAASWYDLSQYAFCIHTQDAFALLSQEVVTGVYAVSFRGAQRLVQEQRAQVSDFTLFVGCCGWGNGQLQKELDTGSPWTLAALDHRTLRKELRYTQLPPRWIRAEQLSLDVGLTEWQRLYCMLGSSFREDAEAWRLDSLFGDFLLQLWADLLLKQRS
eukprot:TRINITY_DN34403_c0_g1_i1.p1 TRINITY_DN34403_c0_g1~~TRINITY_DN34403_c0_g1_i1.p1  ORF type:complete len:344 (-),score=57.41 TRINITY_DN34403_c0_g1_i1:30-1061(-)